MSNSRRMRRRRKQARPDQALLAEARREVRKRDRDDVWRFLVDRSSKRQTIPIPLLVAACEYVGETRQGGTDAVFQQLQSEVLMATGHGMPLEPSQRGPLG